MRAEALAIDVGGTKLAAAWVDDGGRVRDLRVTPTPASADPEVVWRALADLVTGMMASRPATVIGVGIGSAGPLDHAAGTVSPVNIPGWRGFGLRDRVAELTGLPVRMVGDGICAAVGEHWLGAGKGRDDMLGVVVSTGVGGGLILGGRLHLGRTGNAGHIGHIVVDLDGEPCPCGSVGCVEVMASGPSMVRWAIGRGWAAPAEATARDLAAAAMRGDEVALAAFDRAGRALAAGFVTTVAACDLDLVVIGGGLARTGELLLTPVRRWLTRLGGLGFVTDVTVTLAALNDHAGLVGAAALLHRPHRYATSRSTPD